MILYQMSLGCGKVIHTFLKASLLLLLSHGIQAQQKIYSTIYVPSGGQATIFGTQNFANGADAGIISTARGANHGTLNVTQNAQFKNIGTRGYVDGYVRKLGAGSFVFPVGHNGFFGAFAASADRTMGAYVHQNPASSAFISSSKELLLASVSTTEYWDIKGANATRITLTWTAGSNISTFVPQLARLGIAGWKNGKWILIPSLIDDTSISGDASSLSSGSITTTNLLVPNDYQAFTIATLAEPMPVILVNFAARKEGSTVALTWETTFETNSDHFGIERSKDGKNWQTIGKLESFRESSVRRTYEFADISPAAGENLYRLKMVDLDRTFAYSVLRSIIYDNDAMVAVYPNPASRWVKIRNQGVYKQEVRVIDLNGRDFTNSTFLDGNHLNVEKLTSGTYILNVIDRAGNSITSKLIVQRE